PSRPPPSAEAEVEFDGTGGVAAGGAAVPAHAASASGSRMELSLRYGIHPPGAGSAPRQGAAATARECTPGPAFRSTRDPESLARTPAARHVAAFPDSANLPVPGFHVVQARSPCGFRSRPDPHAPGTVRRPSPLTRCKNGSVRTPDRIPREH